MVASRKLHIGLFLHWYLKFGNEVDIKVGTSKIFLKFNTNEDQRYMTKQFIMSLMHNHHSPCEKIPLKPFICDVYNLEMAYIPLGTPELCKISRGTPNKMSIYFFPE